jgi:hypothetical protein
MVVLGLMMLSGLVLAGIGAARITVTMSRSASTPTATFHR